MRLLLLAGLAACAPADDPDTLDADYDGVAAADDCDDADPFVYPGAPDAPGDGVDADCDGADPAHAFVGSWSVIDLEADYGGYAIFVPGSAVGALEVGEDFTTTLDVTVDLDPALAGQVIPLPLTMEGDASPVPGGTAGLSQVYLSGYLSLLDEDLAIEWACDADTEDELDAEVPEMDCAGSLKALDTSLQLLATFAAD